MLKRYLKTNYDMTPDQYRERWNLPADYPMVPLDIPRGVVHWPRVLDWAASPLNSL